MTIAPAGGSRAARAVAEAPRARPTRPSRRRAMRSAPRTRLGGGGPRGRRSAASPVADCPVLNQCWPTPSPSPSSAAYAGRRTPGRRPGQRRPSQETTCGGPCGVGRTRGRGDTPVPPKRWEFRGTPQGLTHVGLSFRVKELRERVREKSIK